MMMKSKKKIIKISCLAGSLFFGYFTYVIFAKMAFVAFFLTMIICCGIYFFQEKRLKIIAIFIGGLFLFILVVVVIK